MTTSSARRGPKIASLPSLTPRTMLGFALLFFVVFHTLMAQRTLDQHHVVEQPSSAQVRGNRGTDWREDWKLRRTQTLEEPSTKRKDPIPAIEDALRGDAEKESHPLTSSANLIRSWGANLTTTPLIYVHIGKAGGGTIRARFSSARPTFEHKDWRIKDMNATYSVAIVDGSSAPAYFCNSGHGKLKSKPTKPRPTSAPILTLSC